MNDELTIGSLIKRYIKMRGKTLKETADAVGIKYTTFSGILTRNVVSAELLFELTNYLSIDLEWMAHLFDHHKPISPLAPLQMPRMQSDFRKHDLPNVQKHLDYCIKNNPTSISDARKELLKIYPNMFYLLDILLPEDDIIRITVERGKEKYHCIPISDWQDPIKTRGRNAFRTSYDGIEALNQVIASRKEEL